MIDTSTNKPIRVSRDGDAGPYLMVPVAQLDEIKALLDGSGVSYWVDEEAISLDGRPEIAVVNLGTRSDPDAVQRLLDGRP